MSSPRAQDCCSCPGLAAVSTLLRDWPSPTGLCCCWRYPPATNIIINLRA